MMNLNTLRASMEAKAAAESNGFTLESMEGRTVIPALPVGLHEVVIDEITSTGTSKTFRMLVSETVNGKSTQYSIELFIGNSTVQADMFMNTMFHLMKQLDMDKFSLETIKSKAGTTICVVAVENVTAKGTFVNYKFDEKSLRAAL